MRTYKNQKLRLRFIYFFDSVFKNKFCWADCVSWAFNFKVKKFNPFNIDLAKTCREESEEYGTCYCGRFYQGLAVSDLNASELIKARNHELSVSEITSIKTAQQFKSKLTEKIVILCCFVLILIIGLLVLEAAFVSSIKF